MKKFFSTFLAALLIATSAFAQQLPAVNARSGTFGGPVRTMIPSTSPGTLIGDPDGLGLMPFGSYRGQSISNMDSIAGRSGGMVNHAFTSNVFGSGTDGPANADNTGMFWIRKKNYLSTTQLGEINAIYCGAAQSRNGDTSCLLGETTKVFSGGAGDTGGALGFELAATGVNTSGVTQNSVHSYGPYIAPANDVASRTGYGLFSESFNGTNYSAFYGGTYLGNDAATGWKNLLVGSTDRVTSATEAAKVYIRIRGDKVTGSQQPGEIVLGSGATTKTLRNNSGTLEIRNGPDTGTIATFGEDGSVSFPSDPPYSTYAPAITCGTGTPTAATAAGRYKAINGGKTVSIRLAITLTTLGTCATSINTVLPYSVQVSSIFWGRNSITPKMLMGVTGGVGTTTLAITDYANGFPFVNGDVLVINGIYERQ